MNENQEQLAFHHQIGVALSQWQNNVEIQLYNIKQQVRATGVPPIPTSRYSLTGTFASG